MNDLEKLRSCQIPSIPSALQDVLKAAADPVTTGAVLERFVIRDPALSLKLIKTVNSSLYSLKRKVSNVGQALVLLGFPAVRSLAAGLVMIETFGKMKEVDQAYIRKLWDHSLWSSRIVELLARDESIQRRDDLVLAGIVHNVGHLVLSRMFPDSYRRLLHENPFPEPETESERFNANHVDVGALLLEEWKFPESTVALVRSHHRSSGRHLMLADQIALGLVSRAGPGPHLQESMPESPRFEPLLAECGWEWPALRSSLVELIEEQS